MKFGWEFDMPLEGAVFLLIDDALVDQFVRRFLLVPNTTTVNSRSYGLQGTNHLYLLLADFYYCQYRK